MRRKKFFATRAEANRFLKLYRKHGRHGWMRDWKIYDLKKNFPRRVKTRFFVGSYFERLNI